MKVVLIFPRNDNTQGITSNGCFPPLGLLSIASYIRFNQSAKEQIILNHGIY